MTTPEPYDLEALRERAGYYARLHREGEHPNACAVCGRPTSDPQHAVELNLDGEAIAPDSQPDFSAGAFPVGPECQKKLPAAFVFAW